MIVSRNQLCLEIPTSVRREAKLSLRLRSLGFQGGTETGWNRAKQLAGAKCLPLKDAKVMSAWFARHGPTAKNGGTSYPGYKRWVKLGKPESADQRRHHRGAMAWLLWGGTPAMKWIQSRRVQSLLKHLKT